MKERRADLVLTLENLNCEEARDCSYVLTSPRSLQACKIVQVKVYLGVPRLFGHLLNANDIISKQLADAQEDVASLCIPDQPVELLYRSVNEVRQQLTACATLDRVLTVYQHQEKARRSKLELCRAVRDQLVAFSTPDESSVPSTPSSIKENLNPSPPILQVPPDNRDSSPKRSLSPVVGVLKSAKRSISPIISKRTPSPSVSFQHSPPTPVTTKRSPSPGDAFNSRKEQLNRENKARSRDGREEALKAVENRLDAPNSKATATQRSPSQTRVRSQQLPAVRVSGSCSSSSRKRSRSRKSTVLSRIGNVRATCTSDGFQQTLPSVHANRPTSSRSSVDTSGRSKSGTSLSSVTSSLTRFTGQSDLPEQRRYSSIVMHKVIDSQRRVNSASGRSLTAVSASGGGGGGGRGTSRTRVCPRWGINTDSNNNSSSRSSSSGGGASKRPTSALQQLSCWLADGVNVPEHDRRILESMAMRREEEHAAEELAHKAHLAWEVERMLREQEHCEQSVHRVRDLVEKRRIEGEQNERKMAELRERETRFQQRLQQSLLEKQARSTAVLRSVGERKGEHAEMTERQKAAVIWAREQLQKEGMLWRLAVQQGQFEKLQRAEQNRLKVKEITHRRVASANRVEELRHAERRRALQLETEENLQLLRVRCREREERAQNLLQRTCGERDRQIRDISEARATRLQSARQIHSELEAGLTRWREQCAALQREAAERAELRVAQQQRERQQRAEAANRAREEHHTLIMSRVSAEQRAIDEARRNAILAKENKMRCLQMRREQAVHESRAQAYTTAELRNQIRRTMSPETFDRLVARSALEARVTSSRTTLMSNSPPSCTRSHILLG